MKSFLIALLRTIGQLARTESGELLSTRHKALRLKEFLSGSNR
jgi:hypothetical protein